MENEQILTVRELIAILSTMPQDARVEMAMGDEYQCGVEASNIAFEPADGVHYHVPTVVIDDSRF